MFGPTDAVGPLTGHIMWTTPLQSGGVVGSGTGLSIIGDTYFEGSAYIQRYMNPIIVNGRIYYSAPKGFSSGSGLETVCRDLRTGEIIWHRADVPQPAFAYIYDVQNYNQHGVMNAILFTANFARAFDADTGEPLFNVTGVPSATAFAKARGPSGEELTIRHRKRSQTANRSTSKLALNANGTHQNYGHTQATHHQSQRTAANRWQHYQHAMTGTSAYPGATNDRKPNIRLLNIQRHDTLPERITSIKRTISIHGHIRL